MPFNAAAVRLVRLEMNCFDGVENGRLKDERQLRRVGTDTYEYLSV